MIKALGAHTPADNIIVEKAIKFLIDSFGRSGHNQKSVVVHSIRVAMLLDQYEYRKGIVVAALLHDLLEDTDTKIEEIKSTFGEEVAMMVQTSTFDSNITDKIERYKDSYKRAVGIGRDPLLIRAADLYDNTYYYHLAGDKETEGALLSKLRYFIEISKPILKSEPIYKNLTKRLKELSNP